MVPKSRDGDVEAIRALRVVRRSAMQGRVKALHQLRALCSTAPQDVRDQLRGLNRKDLLDVCSRMRVTEASTPATATSRVTANSPGGSTRSATSSPASTRNSRRWSPGRVRNCSSCAGRARLRRDLVGGGRATMGTAAERSVVREVVWGRAARSFVGRVRRHRLNRGGDRQANHALWRIVLVRMHCDPRTVNTSNVAARGGAQHPRDHALLEALRRTPENAGYSPTTNHDPNRPRHDPRRHTHRTTARTRPLGVTPSTPRITTLGDGRTRPLTKIGASRHLKWQECLRTLATNGSRSKAEVAGRHAAARAESGGSSESLS